MGYDMYLVEKDQAAEEAKATLREAALAAAQERDALPRDSEDYPAAQEKVDAAFAAMYAADTNYFRLNMRGMGEMVETMHELGMVDTTAEYGDWPKLEAFGLKDYPEADDDNLSPQGRKFLEAHDAVLGTEADSIVGIPLFKFGSNDGWIVTPAEITYALKMFETADRDLVDKVRREWVLRDGEDSYFDRWIAFLRAAANGKGFRVY